MATRKVLDKNNVLYFIKKFQERIDKEAIKANEENLSIDDFADKLKYRLDKIAFYMSEELSNISDR